MSGLATKAEARLEPALPVGLDTRQLTFCWKASIEEIAPEIWGRCFDEGNVLHSWAFARAVERSMLAGVRFHYLVGSVGDQPMVVLPCFEYRVSLAILASTRLQQVIQRLRNFLPGLLYVNTFVVGSPLAICRDFLGIRRLDRPALIAAVLAAAKPALLQRARAAGANFVAIKEAPRSLRDVISAAFTPEFFFVESLPTTFVPVQAEPTLPYAERLRYKYRLQRRNRLKAFENAGFRWAIATDFAPFADKLHRLYLQILDRAAHRFEQLTPAFFREISDGLGEQSFALLCFKQDEIIAFELFLQSRNNLHPLYLGLDYAHRDTGALYFNCIYRIIEEAADRGFPVVELGQSTYDVKGTMGAVIQRLYIGLYHRNPIIHGALRVFQSMLFPAIPAPRFNVFKNPSEARALLKSAHIEYEASDAEGCGAHPAHDT